jgi:hypothetical protein
MVVVLTNSARSAAADAVVDQIDAGAGAGTIELKSAASTVQGTNEVATLTFSTTAFGAASNGVATAAAITDDTNATGGTANDATFFDSNGNAVLQCDVAAAASDINLSSITIGAGDTVTITSLTYTQPAS